MEAESSADNTTDDVLIIEPNESPQNSGGETSTPGQKGVKRLAATPPEKDVKKQKLSPEGSPKSADEEVPNTPKTPKTPKLSKEEREKLKKERMEEKEKQKAERERLLEEKRLEKEKMAEEKRLEREKKEKERLEKKAEEERKKEEKRKEAEEKKRKEEEERMKKEEEKNKKRKEEEEKKEAKRREEEAAEEKKRRASARFMGFFSKVEKKKVPVETQETSSWYRPFEPKEGMIMAPMLPRAPLPSDFNMWVKDETVTLQSFLDAVPKPVIPKPNPMKPKLIQFHDNRRPAYYGTWRKEAKVIRGWCPLVDTEEGIDYDVDSDEEWEDEPSDCEECNSDDDGDKEEEDENEEDDGFFVPPCYLSDGEGEDDSTDAEGEKLTKKAKRVTIDSDGEQNSNEADEDRKARMAQRASEWSKRTEKKKVAKLEPRAIGPVYPPDEPPVEFGYMAAVHFY